MAKSRPPSAAKTDRKRDSLENSALDSPATRTDEQTVPSKPAAESDSPAGAPPTTTPALSAPRLSSGSTAEASVEPKSSQRLGEASEDQPNSTLWAVPESSAPSKPVAEIKQATDVSKQVSEPVSGTTTDSNSVGGTVTTSGVKQSEPPRPPLVLPNSSKDGKAEEALRSSVFPPKTDPVGPPAPAHRITVLKQEPSTSQDGPPIEQRGEQTAAGQTSAKLVVAKEAA